MNDSFKNADCLDIESLKSGDLKNDCLNANSLKQGDTFKIKVAAVTPFVSPGNFEQNAQNTLNAVINAQNNGVEVIVLPLNSFSGDCGDYRLLNSVCENAMDAAIKVIAQTSAVIVFGMIFNESDLLLVASGGKIIKARALNGHFSLLHKFVDKYDWLNNTNNGEFIYKGVEIRPSRIESLEYIPNPYTGFFPESKPVIYVIPTEYPAYIGQSAFKKAQTAIASKRLNCCIALSCSGKGESTVRYVRSGDKIIAWRGQPLAYADFDGEIAIAEFCPDDINDFSGYEYKGAKDNSSSVSNDFYSNNSKSDNLDYGNSESHEYDSRFTKWDTEFYDDEDNNSPSPPYKLFFGRTPRYLPKKEECAEVYDILSRGIVGRIREAKANGVIFGLSGGLDSANVLVAAANAEKYGLDRKNIICVTMPSENSSSRTATNAQKLIDGFGVMGQNVPIGDTVSALLGGINHEKKDVVYENAQARCRATVLLSLANKHNCLVLGTSDLSEMALGFSTYGGDQLAHYNPNNSLTKSAIRFLLREYALASPKKIGEVLLDILDTPVSPELLPNQHTEDILGPYPLHEYFLLRLIAYKENAAQIVSGATKAFSEYSEDYIKKIYNIFAGKFFAHRFKTNFSCDGISLTPYDLSGYNFNSGFDAQAYKIK